MFLNVALEFNKNSFHVCEGYDEDVDKPHDIDKNMMLVLLEIFMVMR